MVMRANLAAGELGGHIATYASAAEIFEVGLGFFLDPANRREESRELGGRLRRFYAFRPGPHYIWGATAAILHDFTARLAPPAML